jgi:hypothetical protein
MTLTLYSVVDHIQDNPEFGGYFSTARDFVPHDEVNGPNQRHRQVRDL